MKSTKKYRIQTAELAAMMARAASQNGQRVHVVPSMDGWTVKREGTRKAYAVRDTRQEALDVARSLTAATQVVIHKRDGSIDTLDP